MSSPHNPLRAVLNPGGRVRRRLAAVESELEVAELRYRGLVERIPAVVYEAECDEHATLRYVSPQIEALLGHSAEAYIADQELWYRSIHSDDLQRVLEDESHALAHGLDFECEYRVATPDGRLVHIWERDAIVRDDAGRPLFSQGVLVDVTALREAEIAVRAERDQARAYIDAASVMFLVLQADGGIGVLNRAGHEMLGYEPGELVGRDWFEIGLPEQDRARLRAAFDDVMAGRRSGPFVTYENTVQHRDGHLLTVDWYTTMTRDAEGRPTAMLCSGIDVSEHRAAERRVAYLASHDSVTGLPNLVLLEEHLEAALARARRAQRSVALLCLGFDDFALVNDSLGHAAGNTLLVKIAERLGERVRASDVLVRKEAAEFMVLLGDLDGDAAEQARAAAVALRGTLREPFEIADTEFHLDASIGISLFPGDATGAEQLMRHADTAMHRSKRGCSDGIAIFSGDSERPLERLSMSTRLRRAIDNDELVLDWQPIVDPGTRMLRRAEALVRWRDPERGLVAPMDFVPFAESTGLIERLGDWVAEHVLAQCAIWTTRGLDPEVAFNVSARELRGAGYAARLLERLERHGVDPQRIVIEVTESVAMSEDGAGDAALRELADASVNVAIDDFGAGWSSLGRLRDLPVRMLKIDRSFLRGVPEDPGATAVVRAILELAAALGIETVAEGVETHAQQAFLVDRDCPLAQGYLLNRPMPAVAMEAELRRSARARRRRSRAA